LGLLCIARGKVLLEIKSGRAGKLLDSRVRKSSLAAEKALADLGFSINQSINLLKAKGPIGHLHRSKIHNIKYIKYINTHKHILLRIA